MWALDLKSRPSQNDTVSGERTIMNNPKIEIREVKSKADLKAFIAVPWPIYADDPNWVPRLFAERKGVFSPNNPFFQHARWKAWIAYRDGKAVGRISAQVDELHLARHDAGTGFYGLLEAFEDTDVFTALFEVAENWLKQQGMNKVIGPFNLSINQEIGCLVEGFDSPPYMMMGHARPYYDDSIKAQGYQKAQDVLAYELTQQMFGLPDRIKRLVDRLSNKITLRQVDRKNATAELDIMRDIFNDAWSENWSFVPFTKEEFRNVGKELLMFVPPDFTWIAEVDGEAAAFMVLMPNLNEAIADLNGRLFPFGWLKLLWRLKVRTPKTGRVPLMGVRKKHQHTRLGPALAFLTIRALEKPVMKREMEKIEMSWILEQNQATRNIIEKVGGVVTKRYRLYQKDLA
jgi:GNAT superfamily N-acetyltransferase